MPVMALISAGIFISMFVADMGGKEPFAMLFVRSIIGVVFLWAAWYLWMSGERNRRVTWVLKHVRAIKVHISASALKSGVLSIRLWQEGSDGRNGWLMLFTPPQWDWRLVNETIADAHIDPHPGGPIILETVNGMLLPLEGSVSEKCDFNGHGKTEIR